jgi:hypothetical protein
MTFSGMTERSALSMDMLKQNLSETYGTRQLHRLLTTASMRSATGEKERASRRASGSGARQWKWDQTIYQHTHRRADAPIPFGNNP